MIGVRFDLLVIPSLLCWIVNFSMLDCQSVVLNSRVFTIIEVDENAPIRTILWDGRIYSQLESSLLLAVVSGPFKATVLPFLSKEIIFYKLLQVFAFSHKDMHAAFFQCWYHANKLITQCSS